MDDRLPTISVNIPTKNSAGTLAACIESVRRQGAPAEIIVADDRSTDGTAELARRMGARVLDGPLPLLEARFQAFLASSGEAIVMLDSDQLLEDDALLRCSEALQAHDVLVLGEGSVEGGGWVSELYAADKRLLLSRPGYHLDPTRANLLPRVFKRWVLESAFQRIPETIRQVAIAQDHAILYRAVAAVTRSTGIVPEAVRHEEMEGLGELWRKYYRWGSDLPALFRLAPELRGLTTHQVAGRLRPSPGQLPDYLRSVLLLALKAVPYSLGYIKGSLSDRSPRRRR